MAKCLFPDHHGTSGRSVVPLAVAVLAAVAVWRWFHAVELAAAAAAVLMLTVLVWRCRRQVRAIAAAVAVTVHVARLVWSLPKASPATRANYPATIRAHVTWRWMARNVALGRPDGHVNDRTKQERGTARQPVLHVPVRIFPDDHGIVAMVRTVPGVGRGELEKAAEHIANHWRCDRVSVSQPRPGRVVVRGFRSDPLLTELPYGSGRPVSARTLWLGRDEAGNDRDADIANVPGIVLGGMPGSGKSTQLASFITQLAPSDAVQFALIDGKGASELDDFAARAWISAGDDLGRAVEVLEEVHALMTERLATVRAVLGHKNGWHAGPSADWPLVVTVIDECQTFFDLTAVKGDKDREAKVRRCIELVASLVRKGRSVMMLTIPATQKPTSDSLPTTIRDNCPVALCAGVKTVDAAAATLGSEIRHFESYSPVTLADRAYAGCFVATLQTDRTEPYVRLRGPWVSEDQAAKVAAATAHLRKDPRATMPVAVPDDARELVAP